MDTGRPHAPFFRNPGAVALRASQLAPVRTDDSSAPALQAVQTARRVLDRLVQEAGVTSDDIRRMRSTLHARNGTSGSLPDWNNRRGSVAFAAAYWELNFWKVYAALSRLGPDVSGLVVDIGCGSGAASAAIMAYAKETGARPARLIAVDRSPEQVGLTGEILPQVRNALDLPVEVTSHVADFNDVLASAAADDRASFVVGSHLVAGQPEIAARLVDAATRRLLRPGGRMILVERPHDEPSTRMLSHVLDRTHETSRYRYAVDLICGRDVRTRHGMTPDIYGVFAYGLMLPRDQLLAQLSADYFRRLWIAKEIDMIRDIFSSDAQYIVLPDDRYQFDRTWTGHAGINEYWRTKVLVQLETDVVTDQAIYDGTTAAFRFAARFRLLGGEEVIAGQMTHEFETGKSGMPKISRLVESYNLTRGRQLPSPEFYLN
jgi:SAM-dependent methyltransferase